MSSVFLPALFLPLPRLLHRSPPFLHLHARNYIYRGYSKGHHVNSYSLQFPFNSHNLQCSISATAPSNEGLVSGINFEEVMEKDWSFLDTDTTNSDEENGQKTERIISAAQIVETSRVLVSLSSESFVDRVVDSSPCEQLLVVHDSLFILACIKEKYDKVNCWQGELIYVPEKWAPFDVVFLYFLPALPFELGQVFGVLAKYSLPGARVVISHPQGRQVVEQQRRQYPDVVVSDLPDKMTLENVATDHSFDMVEFVDEPVFYLSVLKFKGQNNLFK